MKANAVIERLTWIAGMLKRWSEINRADAESMLSGQLRDPLWHRHRLKYDAATADCLENALRPVINELPPLLRDDGTNDIDISH